MNHDVSVNKVTKQFGAITAVDDVSVVVGYGEILALLGPNGAGKSTLLRMIVGLIRPDAGTIVPEKVKAPSKGNQQKVQFVARARAEALTRSVK